MTAARARTARAKSLQASLQGSPCDLLTASPTRWPWQVAIGVALHLGILALDAICGPGVSGKLGTLPAGKSDAALPTRRGIVGAAQSGSL